MSHPSLGLPPIDRISELPPAAARVTAARERLAGRALEIAIDRDPTIRTRYDEYAMRRLLRDAVVLVDRVVDAIAAGDPGPARDFADARPAGISPPAGADERPDHDLPEHPDAVGAVLPATRWTWWMRPSRRWSIGSTGTAGSPATGARRTACSRRSTRAPER